MKRIIALLLTVVLCLCLAACGKAPEPEQSPQGSHTEATNTEAEKPQNGSSSPSGNEAEKLCDKVAIIKGGKLIRSGTMEEVKGDDSLETVFLELEGESC